MTGFGIRQDDIANTLEIDKKTLYKHFRRELDTGMTEANVRVAQALYSNAVKHNNVSAQIWWTKARMGWRDQTTLDVNSNMAPGALHLLAATLVSEAIISALGDSETKPQPPQIEATAEDPLSSPRPTE